MLLPGAISLVPLVGSFILGSIKMAKGCVYLVSTVFQIPEHSCAPAPAHLWCSVHIASFQTKCITTVRSQKQLGYSSWEEKKKKEDSGWSKIWYPCGRTDGCPKGGECMILTLAAGKQTAQPGWVCTSNGRLMTWYSLACGPSPLQSLFLWEDSRYMWVWSSVFERNIFLLL